MRVLRAVHGCPTLIARTAQLASGLGAHFIVAIFYPFSQFCEILIFLLSLQKQPNSAPNLFQRRVEYGKYALLRCEGGLEHALHAPHYKHRCPYLALLSKMFTYRLNKL